MNPRDQLIQALRVTAKTRPDLILAAAQKAGYSFRVNGLSEATSSASGIVTAAENSPNFMDNLSAALAAILSYKQADKLLDINIERAKQGLPALTSESVMPSVNVGVTSGLKNLIVGALVFGGILFVASKVK